YLVLVKCQCRKRFISHVTRKLQLYVRRTVSGTDVEIGDLIKKDERGKWNEPTQKIAVFKQRSVYDTLSLWAGVQM
ncbi:hypothetical protein Bpfe_006589, partial [Biomphalaria pfeifferi]